MDKVRVGLIGTGWWADVFYLPNLQKHPNVILAAICGRNQARAHELAAKYGIPQVFSDYRQMIDSRSLDAVIVYTPEDLHHPMTMAALEAGLHVICEKPLALTATQAREMYQTAQAKGVKHMVAFTMRWLPHFRYLKRLVQDGYLGRPYHGHFDFMTGWGTDVGDYQWYYDPTRAHGVASEVAAHMIDLARWYFGDIARVKASLSTFLERPGPAGGPVNMGNDSAMFILEFVNGAQASIHASSVNLAGEGLRHTGQVIVLHGQAGTLETRAGTWAPPPDSELIGLRRGAEKAETLPIPAEYAGGETLESPFQVFERQSLGPRQFVDAILHGTPLSPNFHDGYKVQQVIEAALESARTQTTISIDHSE